MYHLGHSQWGVSWKEKRAQQANFPHLACFPKCLESPPPLGCKWPNMNWRYALCQALGRVLGTGQRIRFGLSFWDFILTWSLRLVCTYVMSMWKVSCKQRSIRQKARWFKRYLHNDEVSGEEQFLHNHHHSLGPPGLSRATKLKTW